MRKGNGIRLLIMFFAALAASVASAQQVPSYPSAQLGLQGVGRLDIERPSDAAGVFAIWPGSGVPPGSEKWTWHEQVMEVPGVNTPTHMVRNVVIPTVTMFKPVAAASNGTALIVAPGGAFSFPMVDYEGYDMARWLAQQGVTAFVLRYRVAHTPESDANMAGFMQNLFRVLPHPGPKVETPPVGTEAVEQARTWAEKDGRQAIRFVRQHAAEWDVSPHRIGIAGFSACGGVVMGAVMQHDAQSRPDFAAPIYAAYRTATLCRRMRLPCLLRSLTTTRSLCPFPGHDSSRPGMLLANRQSSIFSPKENTASE